MKKKQFLLLFLFSLSAVAQKPSLEEVRLLYQKAEASEEAAELLFEHLNPIGKSEPVLLAYKASGTMLMAKYAINPFNKLSYFNKGKRMLQMAVTAAPQNVEIRFLRFAIQSSTPGFLGYKGYMQEDKRFLMKKIPKLRDEDLSQLMLPFLKNSSYLTNVEKQTIIQATEK